MWPDLYEPSPSQSETCLLNAVVTTGIIYIIYTFLYPVCVWCSFVAKFIFSELVLVAYLASSAIYIFSK